MMKLIKIILIFCQSIVFSKLTNLTSWFYPSKKYDFFLIDFYELVWHSDIIGYLEYIKYIFYNYILMSIYVNINVKIFI